MNDSGSLNPRLFGTNGVRGVFGETLTEDLIIDLVHALAEYYSHGPIAIGFDGRKSSPAIAKLVSATLNSAGLNSGMIGLVPTPCLQFAAKNSGYSGGIMITASHNPPEYNGIKPAAADGVEISRQDELKVEESYYVKRKNYRPNGLGRNYRDATIIPSYVDRVLSLVDSEKIRSRKFTIAVDIGNGAQAVVAPLVAKQLGCKVVVINGQIDGGFPARGSEPLLENLSGLSDAVRWSSADFGVAFDGDGDRSIFCDETGEVHWGDKTGSLLVRHLLTRHSGAEVVCPLNTSMVLSMVAEQNGGKLRYTKVGSVEVSREMVERGSVLGLEENGGFMYGPMNQVRDGAMTMGLVLELLASSPKRFSELVSTLPKTFQYKGKFPCSSMAVVQQVIKACIEHGTPRRVETDDGVKIWIDEETWLMVRGSGTEPLIRMYAESTDKSLLDSKVDEYRRLVELKIKAS